MESMAEDDDELSVAELQQLQQHRNAFNAQLFGVIDSDFSAGPGNGEGENDSSALATATTENDEAKKMAKLKSAQMSDAEWRAKIDILRNWTQLNKAEECKFRKAHRNGYALAKKYQVTQLLPQQNNRHTSAAASPVIEEQPWQLERVVAKSKGGGRIILPSSQVFDAIREAHNDCGHGDGRHGRANPTHVRVQQTYGNIPLEQVKLFVQLCPVCKNGEGDRRSPKRFRSQTQKLGPISYHGKRFACVGATGAGGDFGLMTVFDYHHQARTFPGSSNSKTGGSSIVWGTYSGGSIRCGTLTGMVVPDSNANKLEARYSHVNASDEMIAGESQSTATVLADGRVRLHQRWKQWNGRRDDNNNNNNNNNNKKSSGTLVLDEVKQEDRAPDRNG